MVRDMPVASDPDAVLEHIGPGADLIVPLANGEPVALLDAIEAHGDELEGVRVHQMHALHDRRYLHGAFGDRLRHVSYFLSHVTRPCFRAGTIDLVPNNFSEMRAILAERTSTRSSSPRRRRLTGTATSVSASTPTTSRRSSAEPASSSRPTCRCRARSDGTRSTSARSSVGSTSTGPWSRSLHHLAAPSTIASPRSSPNASRTGRRSKPGSGRSPTPSSPPCRIIETWACTPNCSPTALIDLVDAGVVNGVAKQLNRTKAVGTFALGTRRLYDFLDANAAFELLPVRYVNDPRVIAQEDGFVSINSTIAVDLLGQCASETVGGTYYSSSGGQADFARGAMYSKGGQGFVVLHSTAKQDTISKIVAQLAPGDVVTTLKNTVDKVVTEWGVAELRGRSLRQRAEALIAIAHPAHRDRLRAEAVAVGHL